ncbi:MAG: polysaccharide deacetylase family protein [Alphaproteobacteria bacterium]
MYKFILQWFFAVAALTHPAAAANIPEDSSKAVILAYHRIGEDHLPDQSLTQEQFRQHLQELKNGNYNILPLNQIIEALQNAAPLPPRTVAITLEGAYRSSIENAAPLLLKNAIPFTVFYASDTLDQKDPAYADWKELKTLKRKEIVEIETLPASYNHIAHQPKQYILAGINKARQRHREEFATETTLLSYPYGEYSEELQTLAKSQGYTAAFGLHSGAAYAGSNLYTLPRFSMTELYGDLERFRMITNAYPLPVQDIEPQDSYLKKTGPFFTGFTLPESLQNQSGDLSCFISGQGKAEIETLGNRIEIRANEDLSGQTRIRLNCTMPGPVSENDENTWRWFGLLYHRPEENLITSNPEPNEPLQPQE